MINLDDLLDQKVLLVVLAIGTLIVYLFAPVPNVLYQEQDTSQEVIKFGKNSDCYGVKTTEVECPLHDNKESDNVMMNKEEPHSYNMKNNIKDNKDNIKDNLNENSN